MNVSLTLPWGGGYLYNTTKTKLEKLDKKNRHISCFHGGNNFFAVCKLSRFLAYFHNKNPI
ncbi:MAG: hypothetical protein KH135_01515 [Firmicutes bacterium]|nr:hypothetical protein [Bacillota bacterium]